MQNEMSTSSNQLMNIESRMVIQNVMVPSFKIVDNGIDDSWFKDMIACQEAAYTNKADLIELLYFYDQEGERDIYGIYPDEPWLAELVSSKSWTDDVHRRFWKLWDGDYDSLGKFVNQAYMEG